MHNVNAGEQQHQLGARKFANLVKASPPTTLLLARSPLAPLQDAMKTDVSIPDKVFSRAERLARRTKKSGSQVYSEALNEYVAHHTISITDSSKQ